MTTGKFWALLIYFSKYFLGIKIEKLFLNLHFCEFNKVKIVIKNNLFVAEL